MLLCSLLVGVVTCACLICCDFGFGGLRFFRVLMSCMVCGLVFVIDVVFVVYWLVFGLCCLLLFRFILIIVDFYIVYIWFMYTIIDL